MQKSLELAKKIHICYLALSNKMPMEFLFYMEWGKNTVESEHCIVFDTNNTDKTIIDCVERNFISYLNTDETIGIKTTKSESFDDYFEEEVPVQECCTEEEYFQLSTVYSTEVLNALVVISYLKSHNLDTFYLDLDYVDIILDAMKMNGEIDKYKEMINYE